MTSLRLLHTLQIVCIVAIANSKIVGAFQPAFTNVAFFSTQRRLPSSLSSSVSKSRDTESTSENTIAPVRVVNAAALIHGPAHAAALENDRMQIANGSQQHPGAPATDAIQSPPTSFSSTVIETEQRSEPLPTPPTSPKKSSPPKAKRTPPKSPVTIAESIEELLFVMDGMDIKSSHDGTGESDLTLVLFHAHYCKICQRATMQLTKAAREYPSVNFAKVEAKVVPEPAADSLRNLGVSKFPFVQIFRRGDCVASFSTGPTHMFMRKVRGTLDLCLERDEDCWDAFTNDFATEIESNRDARKSLIPELLP